MVEQATRKYRSRPVGPSPRSSSAAVSRSMKSNKGSGTKPELVLSHFLRKRIISNDLPGDPDFIYRRSKLAVFVHGCFWHRCPIDHLPLPKTHRAFWRRKFERNVERDRLNREELEAMGWRVMEIWEHEVKEDPKSVAANIRKLARKKNPFSHVPATH